MNWDGNFYTGEAIPGAKLEEAPEAKLSDAIVKELPNLVPIAQGLKSYEWLDRQRKFTSDEQRDSRNLRWSFVVESVEEIATRLHDFYTQINDTTDTAGNALELVSILEPIARGSWAAAMAAAAEAERAREDHYDFTTKVFDILTDLVKRIDSQEEKIQELESRLLPVKAGTA